MTTLAALVLGVDPGAASCGLIVRVGAELVSHTTVIRAAEMSRAEWVEACLAGALNLVNPLTHLDLVAVEDVNVPNVWHNGRKQVISPASSIETAAVAGAVTGWAWADHCPVQLVPPAKNGQGPLELYPNELRPTRGKGAGADKLRHCRSAWDVAHTGLLYHRSRRVA